MTSTSTDPSDSFPDPQIHLFAAASKALLDCESRPQLLASSAARQIETELAAAIESRETRVLSLDVFDTFLLRNNIPETQRYFEISQRIASAISQVAALGDHKHVDEYDLLLQRLRALELNYRTRPAIDGCREGSLSEVVKIQRMALSFPPQAEETMLRAELEYEAASLVPNPVLLNLARSFRQAGGKVILLSDMYLGKKEIAEVIQLVDSTLSDSFDEIISSSDTIVSKRSGKVFGLVEKKLDEKPERILHIGDSWHSDVHMARSAGWQALHFPVSTRELHCREQNLKSFVQAMYLKNLDLSRWAKI